MAEEDRYPAIIKRDFFYDPIVNRLDVEGDKTIIAPQVPVHPPYAYSEVSTAPDMYFDWENHPDTEIPSHTISHNPVQHDHRINKLQNQVKKCKEHHEKTKIRAKELQHIATRDSRHEEEAKREVRQAKAELKAVRANSKRFKNTDGGRNHGRSGRFSLASIKSTIYSVSIFKRRGSAKTEETREVDNLQNMSDNTDYVNRISDEDVQKAKEKLQHARQEATEAKRIAKDSKSQVKDTANAVTKAERDLRKAKKLMQITQIQNHDTGRRGTVSALEAIAMNGGGI